LREALEALARDGLVELGGETLAVTAAGRAFLPRIGLAFDRYLQRAMAA
jgi:coproporphyrinogen III oxidase-like Fe-S oxidoreductase